MTAYEDVFTTSQDGLKLHARRWGPALPGRTPVVCLPGLTRNTDDFDDIAAVLTAADDRAIYALDYRGRGLSDYDPDWKNYDVRVEIGDVLDQITALGISEAIFLGTSRGGILTMIAAMLRPTLLRGAILNDVGPVIDGKGLARIRNYVGKLPQPTTFAEGAAILKQTANTQFPALDDAGWEAYGRRTWKEENGKLVTRYDTGIMKTLELLDLEAPLPELWPQFEGLKHVPVLVLRGAHSDLLSPETALEMTRRHPDCALHEVPFEGHAPLMADAPTQQRILDFVHKIDATHPHAGG